MIYPDTGDFLDVAPMTSLPTQYGSVRNALPDTRAFTRSQYPAPLPSGLGSTDVLLNDSLISQSSATIKQNIMKHSSYLAPSPSHIGEGDLPGGFRKSGVLTGRINPALDFAKGIVRIDGVAVLFQAVA